MYVLVYVMYPLPLPLTPRLTELSSLRLEFALVSILMFRWDRYVDYETFKGVLS